MDSSSIRKEQFKIISITTAYLFATYFLTLVGPVKYASDYQPVRIFIFVAFVIACCFIGYIASGGLHSRQYWLVRSGKIPSKEVLTESAVRLINLCTLIGLLVYAFLWMDLLQARGISVITTLSDLGKTYQSYLHLDSEGTSLIGQISVLFSAASYVSMVGGIAYFSDKRLHRKLFITFAAVSILEEVARSAQLAYVVTWLLTFAFISLIRKVSSKTIRSNCRGGGRKKAIVLLALLFFIIFSSFQQSRANTYGYTTESLSTKYFYYNHDYPLYKLLPISVADSVAYLDFYLSNGYYGLDRNLDTTFEWTFGYGNSKALSSYLNQYLNAEDSYQSSYPMRTEKETGYPSGQYWCTAFAWFAGDFSFFGVPFLYMIFMIIMLRSYASFRLNSCFPSLLVFLRMATLFAFTPATNYIFQTRQNLLITVGVFIIWLIFRVKGDVKNTELNAEY